MKKQLCVAVGLLLAVVGQAAVYDQTWSSGFLNNGGVPDNDGTGWVDSRTVEGLTAERSDGQTVPAYVAGLTVNLHLSVGWNGDIVAYLQHDNGFTYLLNRVGVAGGTPQGNPGSGFNVTFSGAGSSGLHSYTGNGTDPITGVWRPDGVGFASFDGQGANGVWRLFVADLNGGDVMTVNSWGLHMDLSAVPEPGEWMSIALAVLGMAYVGKRSFMRGAK